MRIDALLSRLEKVKSANGEFMALCPAHQDHNPSLTLKETPDGKILMKCWAGCTVYDICSALELDITDLFPDKVENYEIQQREFFNHKHVFNALYCDLVWLEICAKHIADYGTLCEENQARLAEVSQRFHEAHKHINA